MGSRKRTSFTISTASIPAGKTRSVHRRFPPATIDAFGSDGQALFSIKQSRFGVSGDLPTNTDIGDVKFKFEFDLFGVGVDAGQTTIRLRHVYGEWGMLLVGQTNSVFMDGDVFPNTIDYWGPAGMVFFRNVQIRWTPYRTDNSHFAIAIERPGNDVDAGTLRELDPELGANLQNDEKLPDLTAHYYTSGDWGHFQLAGIVRHVRIRFQEHARQRAEGQQDRLGRQRQRPHRGSGEATNCSPRSSMARASRAT